MLKLQQRIQQKYSLVGSSRPDPSTVYPPDATHDDDGANFVRPVDEFDNYEQHNIDMVQQPHDLHDVSSIGTYKCPYTGQVSEFFEQNLPPPNDDLVAKPHTRKNFELTRLSGGEDPTRPRQKRVEVLSKHIRPMHISGKPTIPNMYHKATYNHSLKQAVEHMYHKRDGILPMEQQIPAKDQPVNKVGYVDINRYEPNFQPRTTQTTTYELPVMGPQRPTLPSIARYEEDRPKHAVRGTNLRNYTHQRRSATVGTTRTPEVAAALRSTNTNLSLQSYNIPSTVQKSSRVSNPFLQNRGVQPSITAPAPKPVVIPTTRTPSTILSNSMVPTVTGLGPQQHQDRRVRPSTQESYQVHQYANVTTGPVGGRQASKVDFMDTYFLGDAQPFRDLPFSSQSTDARKQSITRVVQDPRHDTSYVHTRHTNMVPSTVGHPHQLSQQVRH